MFAHLSQLELHAAPFASEIDPHDAVVILTGGVSRLREDILDARIVVSGIQPAESRDRLRDHGFDLRIVGDVAGNGEGSVALRGQLLGRSAHSVLVPVCERDGRS